MTFLKDGFEHLDDDETRVRQAVRSLTAARRTGNNSQIAAATGLSRTAVGRITDGLRARGFLTDVSKGAAHHWRLTGVPVPRSVESRRRELAEIRRAREMNEAIRAGRTS